MLWFEKLGDGNGNDDGDELSRQLRQMEDQAEEARRRGSVVDLDPATLLAGQVPRIPTADRARVRGMVSRLARTEPARAQPARPAPRSCDPLPVLNAMLIGEILIQLGIVDEDGMNQALNLHRETGRPIGEVLVENGLATEEDLQTAARLQGHLRGEPAKEAPATVDTEKVRRVESDAGLRTVSELLLGQILVREGLVEQARLDEALDLQRATGLRIGEALVQTGAATPAEVEHGLARQRELAQGPTEPSEG